MNNAIVEYVNGIEVIKAFNQSASSYGKFTDSVKFFRDSTLDWWKGCWLFSSIGYTVISSTLLFSLPLGAYWFRLVCWISQRLLPVLSFLWELPGRLWRQHSL